MEATKKEQRQFAEAFIQYHVAFCPRYRRKIFDVGGVKEWFYGLAQNVCRPYGAEITDIRFGPDYVYLTIRALPTHTPHELIQRIKNTTAAELRDEFPQFRRMNSVWTRDYFISTSDTDQDASVRAFVDKQPTRP